MIFYVVTKGRQPGIYLTALECKINTKDYPDSDFKTFKSLKLAQEYFDDSQLNNSMEIQDSRYYVVLNGTKCGVYNTKEEALKYSLNKNEIKEFESYKKAKEFFFKKSFDCAVDPHLYDSESDTETEVANSKVYYSIAKGNLPGIYDDPNRANECSYNYNGFKMKRCSSLEEAIEFYAKYADVKNPVFYLGQTTKETTDDKLYYVVTIGRKPGLYYSSEDCRKQTDGIPGQKSKKFTNLKEAEDYLNSSKLTSRSDRNVPSLTAIETPTPVSLLNSVLPDSNSHSRHSSLNSKISISYSSHLLYVRIPNPILSKRLVTKTNLDQFDWIKHGITSQSLDDRNSRLNFQEDGGYFKYTVALNERAHCESVEEYFNTKFKRCRIQGKTEYFMVNSLATYYQVDLNDCEQVAEAHFCGILRCILTRYPEYLDTLTSRIQTFTMQINESNNPFDAQPIKVNMIPATYELSWKLKTLMKKMKERTADEQSQVNTHIQDIVERANDYHLIPNDKWFEKSEFKLNFFTDLIQGRTTEEIIKLGAHINVYLKEKH